MYVRLGQLQYDELRLGVTRPATGDTIVDPATSGRYVGPFRPGDQDTIIYLADALDGSQLHCEATAFSAGAAVGTGVADMLVARGTIKVVEIVMIAPGAPSPPADPPADPPPNPPTDGSGCSSNGKDVIPKRACDAAGKCEDGEKPMHCPEGTTCVAGVCS